MQKMNEEEIGKAEQALNKLCNSRTLTPKTGTRNY